MIAAAERRDRIDAGGAASGNVAREYGGRGEHRQPASAYDTQRHRLADDIDVALTATVYAFEIELAHVDRGVYESLAFRVAQHPSESPDFLLARVLAFCLEYTAGIRFSPGGLSDPDEPALAVRDPTGTLLVWIEIGVPDAARLHKAAKAAPRVVVYTHKEPGRLVRLLAGERMHRAGALEIYAIDRDLLAGWASRLARRMVCALTVSDGHLYLTIGETTLTGAIQRIALAPR
jgi:uncharacterized protein YaeQ